MKACMGGWCKKREKCPHYQAGDFSKEISERLCESGRDGVRVVDTSPFRTIRVEIFSREMERMEAA